MLLVDKEHIKVFLIDLFFFVTALIITLSDGATLPIIGYALIILSIYMIIKTRRTKYLFILILIVSIINISIGINDFVQMGKGISAWQSSKLRNTEYDILSAKSVLLFISVVNFFINGKCCEDDNQYNIDDYSFDWGSNKVISYVGLVALYVLLLYAIRHEILLRFLGTYVSVSNPIYEYSVVIFVLVWLYSKDLKAVRIFHLIYAFLFSIAFLLIGDRSSVSMYVLAVLLMATAKYHKIKPIRIIIFIIIGILGVNLIGLIRDNPVNSLSEIVGGLIDRAFYLDTASWAYYSGITIIAAGINSTNVGQLFLSFIESIFGMSNQFSNMPEYARSQSSLYYNLGGGFFASYFYAWLGILGVIISAAIVGYIINRIFNRTSRLAIYYQQLLIVFVIRWYVYTPLCFFRSIFVVGSLAYFVCKTINDTMIRNTNR